MVRLIFDTTNSTPYGTVNVNANTCCGTNHKVDKIEKLQKIKTTDWKEGIYYIVFSYKGQKYYEKISVKK
jgi:hypothetical protein